MNVRNSLIWISGLLFLSLAQNVSAQEADSLITVDLAADSVQTYDMSLVPANIRAKLPTRQSSTFARTFTIVDQDVIQWLVDNLLLNDPTERVDSLVFIDVTTNGFGPDDIVIYEPSGNTYFLAGDVFENVRAYMSEWRYEDGLNLSSGEVVGPEDVDPESDGFLVGADNLAEYSILSDLLRGVQRNYGDTGPIQLYLDRKEGGNFTFRMMGYDENRMVFEPRGPGIPDSVAVWDILFSDRMVADTTYRDAIYDLLFIDRVVEETIFMPSGLSDEERLRIQQMGAERRQRELERLSENSGRSGQ